MMIFSRLLKTVLVLLLVPATVYAATQSERTPASMGLTSLSISAGGTATVIGNHDPSDEVRTEAFIATVPLVLPTDLGVEMHSPRVTTTASLSISATIIPNNSSALIAYTVTGSSLTIGETHYQIVNGTGIFNQHSLVVVLHATATKAIGPANWS